MFLLPDFIRVDWRDSRATVFRNGGADGKWRALLRLGRAGIGGGAGVDAAVIHRVDLCGRPLECAGGCDAGEDGVGVEAGRTDLPDV